MRTRRELITITLTFAPQTPDPLSDIVIVKRTLKVLTAFQSYSSTHSSLELKRKAKKDKNSDLVSPPKWGHQGRETQPVLGFFPAYAYLVSQSPLHTRDCVP
jgi:hypothetical protein